MTPMLGEKRLQHCCARNHAMKRKPAPDNSFFSKYSTTTLFILLIHLPPSSTTISLPVSLPRFCWPFQIPFFSPSLHSYIHCTSSLNISSAAKLSPGKWQTPCPATCTEHATSQTRPSPYQERGWQRACCCLVAKSCPTFCPSMDCSLLGSSVHGLFQARILDWVAMPSSRGASQLRDQTHVFCIAGRFFTTKLPSRQKFVLKSPD